MNTQVKNKYITLHYIKIILKWAGDQLNRSVALQEKILRHAETLSTRKMKCPAPGIQYYGNFTEKRLSLSFHVQYITCTQGKRREAAFRGITEG